MHILTPFWQFYAAIEKVVSKHIEVTDQSLGIEAQLDFLASAASVDAENSDLKELRRHSKRRSNTVARRERDRSALLRLKPYGSDRVRFNDRLVIDELKAKILAIMDDKQKRLVELLMDGYTDSECAEALNIESGAFRARKYRLLTKLRSNGIGPDFYID